MWEWAIFHPYTHNASQITVLMQNFNKETMNAEKNGKEDKLMPIKKTKLKMLSTGYFTPHMDGDRGADYSLLTDTYSQFLIRILISFIALSTHHILILKGLYLILKFHIKCLTDVVSRSLKRPWNTSNTSKLQKISAGWRRWSTMAIWFILISNFFLSNNRFLIEEPTWSRD